MSKNRCCSPHARFPLVVTELVSTKPTCILLPVEAWEPPSPEKAVRRPRTLAARLDVLSRSRHGLSWTGRGPGRRLACVPRSFLPISGSSRAQSDAYGHLLRTQGSSRFFHSRVRSPLEITSRCSNFLGGGIHPLIFHP